MRSTICLILSLALAGCATTSAAPARDYVAHFNEPFLIYVSEGSQLTLRSPDKPKGVIIAAGRKSIDDETRFSWKEGDGTLELVIRQEQCFDDMAGSEYSHSAQLLSSEYAGFMGCARLTSEPQPREK